jgi:cytochrome b561
MRTASLPRGEDYDPVAKSFHWLIVALFAVQFGVAWLMPHVSPRTALDGRVQLHLSIGLVGVALVLLRLGWRLSHRAPPLPDSDPAWQRLAASAAHLLLYLLALVMPLLGWVSAGLREMPMGLFGLVTLPQLLPAVRRLGGRIGHYHALAAYATLALIGLHIAAALYHHFLLRDPVLRRMLPKLG